MNQRYKNKNHEEKWKVHQCHPNSKMSSKNIRQFQLSWCHHQWRKLQIGSSNQSCASNLSSVTHKDDMEGHKHHTSIEGMSTRSICNLHLSERCETMKLERDRRIRREVVGRVSLTPQRPPLVMGTGTH